MNDQKTQVHLRRPTTGRSTILITLAVGACFSVATSVVLAGERVTNGGFGSSTGWNKWVERGSTSENYNYSGGDCPSGGSGACLRQDAGGNFNGGYWQQLSLVNGQSYTLSLYSKDWGSNANSAWAEVRIGTSAPSNGSDYTQTQEVKWDTFACNDWNGHNSAACVQSDTSFTASSNTMYIVLKSGQTGGNPCRVSWDSISVDGPDPCTPPNAPSNPLPAASGTTDKTTTSITWRWTDNSGDETGFKVWADAGTGNPTTLRTTTAANATSYSGYTGLGVNTVHSMQVAATNGTCDSAKTTKISRYTLANTPSAPTVNNPSGSTLDVNVNPNSNPGSTEFAIVITGGAYAGDNDYVNASGGINVNGAAVWQTDSTWGAQTVNGLAPGTMYTFKVKARNGDDVETSFGSGASGTTTACTAVTASCNAPYTGTADTFGYDRITPEDVDDGSSGGVISMYLTEPGGTTLDQYHVSHDSNSVLVMSQVDGNVIKKNGTTQATINTGQTTTISVAQGDRISGSGPFCSDWENNQGSTLNPSAFAGHLFAYYANRDTPRLGLRALSAASTVTITEYPGGSTFQTINLTANGTGTANALTNGNRYVISATQPVLVHSTGDGANDAFPVPPAHTEIFGVPSGNGFVTVAEDSTSVTYYTSSGSTVGPTSYDAGDLITIVGASQGNSFGVRVVADKPIGGSSIADADGGDGTAWYPKWALARSFIIPRSGEYVVVVPSTPGATIDVVDGGALNGSYSGGGSGSSPGFRHLGSTSSAAGTVAAGMRIFVDAPAFVYYEPDDDDETNLNGDMSAFLLEEGGSETVTLNVYNDCGNSDTCTSDVDVPSACVNQLVNGDWSSGSSGWSSWAERGSATFSYTTTGGNCPTGGTGNCARISQPGNFNGGIYRTVQLVGGASYTVEALSKDVNSTASAAWGEIHVGATAPVNGSDYTVGETTKWDTFGCDNWNGNETTACVTSTNAFTATAGTKVTMYVVLKSGQTGGATTDVSWDDVQICGANPGPTVQSVAVNSGNNSGGTVDVTFDEAMGTGVTTASNYTVSGTGKGTLTNNPNSVAIVSGNTYRLTWTSGEMVCGGNITITVNSAVEDTAGATMLTPNSGTDTGGALCDRPDVTSINRQTPAAQDTNAASVTWRVVFDESISAGTVGSADFTLVDVGSTITGESISGTAQVNATTWDVTANTGSGDGTLRLDVIGATASINDAAGNDITSDFTTGQTYNIDKTLPQVNSVNRQTPAGQTTAASSVTWRVTFSEDMNASTVQLSDFTLTDVGGTITGETLTGSPSQVNSTTWDVTANTGSGSGTLRLDVLPAATLEDTEGNDYNSTFNTGQTYIIDKSGPLVTTVNRQTPAGQVTNAASVTWRVTFDEDINASTVQSGDFTLVDVSSTITGESITGAVQFNSQQWDVTADTGTGSGTLRLDVLPASTIEDTLGNDYNATFNTGQTYIIDNAGPVCTITRDSPASCPTASSTATYSIDWDEDVSGTFTVGDITFDAGSTGASLTNFSGSGANYSVDVTGISASGTFSLEILDSVVTDTLGNANTLGCGPASCIVDLSPPTCSITRLLPAACPTNAALLRYQIDFSEGVQNFVIGDITLDHGGTSGSLTNFQAPGGNCVEPVVNGNFSSGSSNWTTWAERGSGTLDFAATTCPTGGSAPCFRITNTGNFNGGAYQTLSLVSGNSYTLRVVSRDIGSTAGGPWAEVLVGTAAPSNGSDYKAGSPSGTSLLAKWNTITCDNWNGNQTTACVEQQLTFNASASTMYLLLKGGNDGEGGQTVDVAFDNVFLCDPTTNDRFTVDVTGMATSGTISISVGAGVANDAEGNLNTGCGPLTCEIDYGGPVVLSINRQTPTAQYTNSSTVTWRVVFDQDIDPATVQNADFTLTDVSSTLTGEVLTGSPTQINSTTWDVTADTGTGDGTLRLDHNFSISNITDLVGNESTSSFQTGETYIIDRTAPLIQTRSPTAGSSVADPFTSIDVTFDEAMDVGTFDGADMTINATPATGVSGSGAGPYTFTFANPANGTLNIALLAAMTDLAGNSFAGDNWTYEKGLAPQILTWNSVRTHGSFGEVGINVNNDSTFSTDSRNGTVQDVRITLNEAVEVVGGPLSTAITFETSPNGVSSWTAKTPDSISLANGDTEIHIALATSGGNAPSNTDFCRFTINAGRIRSPGTGLFIEDDDPVATVGGIRTYKSDATANGLVTSADVVAIRTAILLDLPFDASVASLDINLNGLLDTLDMAITRFEAGP